MSFRRPFFFSFLNTRQNVSTWKINCKSSFIIKRSGDHFTTISPELREVFQDRQDKSAHLTISFAIRVEMKALAITKILVFLPFWDFCTCDPVLRTSTNCFARQLSDLNPSAWNARKIGHMLAKLVPQTFYSFHKYRRLAGCWHRYLPQWQTRVRKFWLCQPDLLDQRTSVLLFPRTLDCKNKLLIKKNPVQTQTN